MTLSGQTNHSYQLAGDPYMDTYLVLMIRPDAVVEGVGYRSRATGQRAVWLEPAEWKERQRR